jgi:hypothetical protein
MVIREQERNISYIESADRSVTDGRIVFAIAGQSAHRRGDVARDRIPGAPEKKGIEA